MSMKNSNDTIGNRTRDLPTCKAVPQLTVPPRAPIKQCTSSISYTVVYVCPTGKCYSSTLATLREKTYIGSVHSKQYISFTVVWENTWRYRRKLLSPSIVKMLSKMYPLTLLYKEECMVSFSIGSYFKDKDVWNFNMPRNKVYGRRRFQIAGAWSIKSPSNMTNKIRN